MAINDHPACFLLPRLSGCTFYNGTHTHTHKFAVMTAAIEIMFETVGLRIHTKLDLQMKTVGFVS